MKLEVLLLIDIQRDFCPGGALAVPQGDEVVAVANRLMAGGKFDHVIATQDWHPADHKSFAANHPGRSLYEIIELGGCKQVLWPQHCVQGSRGAELHPGLSAALIEKIIAKGERESIDSYSAFYDNDGRNETGLRAHLESLAGRHGIGLNDIRLTICGLATDYCVLFSARDARQRLGLDVRLVLDGCRAVNLNPGDDVRALSEMAQLGVQIVESREVLNGPQLARTAGLKHDIAVAV